MTENIPQTSASDRIEAARKALAAAAMYGVAPGMSAQREARMVLDLVEALRALITPPSVGENVEQIAARIQDRVYRDWLANESDPRTPDQMVYEAAQEGIRVGIQYAHERWEPADRPSQEQMLRWLGIEYRFGYGASSTGGDMLHIYPQQIEREEV